MRAVLLAAFLAACSPGLVGLGDSQPSTPDDTGLGQPIDSADSEGSAPVADAGPDQTASVGDVVQLDGSGSHDPDEDPLTWSWQLVEAPAGSTATLINATQVDPSFWADRAGVFRVRLTVGDGVTTAADEVAVVVTEPNGGPVADAGPDQTVSEGDLVQLNGTGSSDPDGDTLSFVWSLVARPAGSAAFLSTPTGSTPRFTADKAGTYRVSLVVGDGTTDSAPDEVLVIAQSADDGDCLSCSASVRHALRDRLRRGDAASGMVLLPLALLLWHRKRRPTR